MFGLVAQWLEQVSFKHEVVGSSPTRPISYLDEIYSGRTPTMTIAVAGELTLRL